MGMGKLKRKKYRNYVLRRKKMENLTKILKHIEDLYAEEDVQEESIEKWKNKYPERVKMWEDALEKFSDGEILYAIDEYWRFKDSTKKPKLVHIQAMLTTRKREELEELPQKDYSGLAKAAEATAELLRQEAIKKYGV